MLIIRPGKGHPITYCTRLRGGVELQLYSFLTLVYVRVGGQCHAPATLSLRAPVSIVKDAGWAPGLVRMDIEERKTLVHTGV